MKQSIKQFLNKYPSITEKLKRAKYYLNKTNRSSSKQIHGVDNIFEIHPSAILKNCTIDVEGDHNRVIINENCRLYEVKIYIRGNHNLIVLDSNVTYQSGLLWEVCNHGRISIGENTTIEENVNFQIAEDHLTIAVGQDCMFSSNIFIWPQDWHPINNMNRDRINQGKSISIENHVWVGYDVKILKGVIIGSNNIIGTNALITKSFEEEHVIIAGNPGKITKRDIHWER
ncbi:acyltransferase [Sphingobacterium sp. HJSM2_6]|uniref:acyltransferase n=1 Tax=Sphingobacterium sp. HJSM2_6 TaxID=3366264 RepID=UPI003BD704C2